MRNMGTTTYKVLSNVACLFCTIDPSRRGANRFCPVVVSAYGVVSQGAFGKTVRRSNLRKT
jgi:hypothetical protein